MHHDPRPRQHRATTGPAQSQPPALHCTFARTNKKTTHENPTVPEPSPTASHRPTHLTARLTAVVFALLSCLPAALRAEDPTPTITFRELLQHARRDPPSVRLAHANFMRAQADRAQAEGTWLPAITAQGTFGLTYNDQIIFPGVPRIDSLSLDTRATLGVEWTGIDLARSATIRARGASEQAQRMTQYAAQRTAAALAAELYVRACAATELVEDARLSLERRSTQFQAISDLVHSGTRSPVEAERARVEMVSAKYALSLRQNDEKAAFAALAAAMGRPATQPVRPASTTADLPAITADMSAPRAAELAAKHREELAAAAWAVKALRESWSSALLERLPTAGVTGNGFYYYTDVRHGYGIEGSQYGATGALFLRWRGIDPAITFRARVAEAAEVQAERERDNTLHAIKTDAVAAFHALQRAKLEHDRADEVLKSAQVTREAQNDRYRAGVASLLELLDAENLEQTARQRRIEAERDEAVASVQLLSTCGLLP
jgi:outer membrane protein